VRYTLRAEALHDSRPMTSSRSSIPRSSASAPTHASAPSLALNSICAAQPRPVLDVSTAGHPPPLLIHRDGRSETIETRGTVLGVLGEPQLECRELRLTAGDALVLYTDGLLEAHAPRQILAPAELAPLGPTSPGAAALVEALHRRAVDPDRGPPRDDIAILAAQLS
jgi:stage II sporulation SpoE-like protein